MHTDHKHDLPEANVIKVLGLESDWKEDWEGEPLGWEDYYASWFFYDF